MSDGLVTLAHKRVTTQMNHAIEFLLIFAAVYEIVNFMVDRWGPM